MYNLYEDLCEILDKEVREDRDFSGYSVRFWGCYADNYQVDELNGLVTMVFEFKANMADCIYKVTINKVYFTVEFKTQDNYDYNDDLPWIGNRLLDKVVRSVEETGLILDGEPRRYY